MNLRRLCYGVLLIIVASLSALAQGPEGNRWWDGPIAKDLGLTPEQSSRVRDTVRASRPQLIQLRGSVQLAEAELRDEMAADPVDRAKAGEAIDKVVKARGELMLAVSRMSLDLRMILTASQWQELERRRPRGAGVARPARRPPGTPRPDAGMLPENQ